MISNRQSLSQKLSQQQRLSPQQIQFVKMLQLPMSELTQRIQEELEANPVLEYLDISNHDTGDLDRQTEGNTTDSEPSDTSEVDWEQLYAKQDRDLFKPVSNHPNKDIIEQPRTYYESLIEQLEHQVDMLSLDEKQHLIADQILGSIDSDGYFRRALSSVADSIAFNHGIPVSQPEVLEVLKKIQNLEPPGIAARDLRECLLIQLQNLPKRTVGRDNAIRIIKKEWELFEKKHFDRISAHLNLSDNEIKQAYLCIQNLDPKPGGGNEIVVQSAGITPDVMVVPLDGSMNAGDADSVIDELAIILHTRNRPKIAISPHYLNILNNLPKSGISNKEIKETQQFLKTRIEAAKVFIESLELRGGTLLAITHAIVERQYTFFMNGTSLKPMIMKDIAEAIDLDISTISRTVNGKYVQTNHGTYELRFFFNEGIETSDGSEVTNREVQQTLAAIISSEDKSQPMSDLALTKALNMQGVTVARRTVTKYREALGIPVARLRKEMI
jgi:RNA polymerase sigma-54 factor